jgi:hypothetical protein
VIIEVRHRGILVPGTRLFSPRQHFSEIRDERVADGVKIKIPAFIIDVRNGLEDNLALLVS